jgi:hypothetical protein
VPSHPDIKCNNAQFAKTHHDGPTLASLGLNTTERTLLVAKTSSFANNMINGSTRNPYFFSKKQLGEQPT